MAAISYDPEDDAVYIELTPEVDPDATGLEVYPGVILMRDGAGKLIGFVITPASRVMPAGAVERLPLWAAE